MVDFETYTCIIQHKVLLDEKEKEVREELDTLRASLSEIVGQYMYSITLHLPLSYVISVSLLQEHNECINILEQILSFTLDNKNELQSVIDNHYDADAFREYLKHFEERLIKLDKLT